MVVRGRRRPTTLLAGLIGLTVLVGVVFALVGRDPHKPGRANSRALPGSHAARSTQIGAPSTAVTSAPHPTTTSKSAARGSGTKPVVTTTLNVVDRSRPLVRNGIVLASYRALPTTVWMPAVAGRFPLVVFVHGYNIGPAAYARFCRKLASAGFVVAAPSFPLEDPSRNNGLDRGDLPNEAVDVGVVITHVLESSVAPHIAPGSIAVVGHSDGADVALMVGYQVGRLDTRVRAVVAVAPDPLTGVIASNGPPLLLVQGDADSINPYSNSQQVFAQLAVRRYFLTLIGADHFPPIRGGTPWTPVLDASVAEFLHATTGHHAPNDPGLANHLRNSSLVRLEVALLH